MSSNEEFEKAVVRTKLAYGKFFPAPDWAMLEAKFREDDEGTTGYLSLEDLKRVQQKMDNPITHAQLSNMLQTVAEDPKKGLSFEDFIKMQLVVQGHDLEKITTAQTAAQVPEAQRESFSFWAERAIDRKVNTEMRKLDLERLKDDERAKLERRQSRDQFKKDFSVFGQLITPRCLPGK
mmetsp:Transcript_20125/g.27754  ORF Transcript_20125/g.27754 Transcript_20125/m.27754 type:complete len:179 (-) Transcript_20125:125-661(-)|eukprot:CAMPEP_0201486622 /NCGR_PEP_ID=MMETSP0151_2-20130828/10683_1 /ASSEMBLY_ACC=CAM_ASM_000257 /TAXON_ID=200890 /ORGANISM="Paramoeba atlantica, Strain 621/1 / CCAP 1560/9" /LENGTH=178 /DNA_ID=CAMNT_0047871363 /DNA_START=204 /DNA_END=740 /DNA_ORIENTATION=+